MKNQGLEDVTITNNGATVDNNGKIGKCYSFDGNSSQIRFDSDWIPAMQGHDFTIAFWAYNNDDGERSVMFATTPTSGWGISIEKTTGNTLRVYWQANPDIIISDFTLPVGEWVHIAETYTNNSLYVYKNGEKIYERLNTVLASNLTNTWSYASIGRDVRTGSTAFKGKLNDFRWYDHALSPREVKEISKGLVCHYTLAMPGNENLIITNSITPASGTSGWYTAGTGWTNSNVISEGASSGRAIRCTYSGTTQTSGGIYHPTGVNKEDLTNGAVYTLSARIRASKNCRATFHNELQGSNTINLTTEWKTYSFSDAIDNTHTYYSNTIYVLTSDIEQNMWIECDWIKFEKGSVATPWTPNPADTLYTKMGFDDGIEYDVSGYGRNGTKIGTITVETDTPRYWTSSGIKNGNNHVQTPVIDTAGFKNSWTICAWVKTDRGGAMPWGSINGNRLNLFLIEPICNNTADSLSNPFMNNGVNVSQSAVIDNNWHHVAVTGDGTENILYIDGEYAGTAKTYKPLTATQFMVNGWNSSSNYSINGAMSDFRIYATALSAEDILALYNNPVSLSSNGALLTQGEVTE